MGADLFSTTYETPLRDIGHLKGIFQGRRFFMTGGNRKNGTWRVIKVVLFYS